MSSVLGSGSGYGSTGSYGVTDSYKYRKQSSFEQTNKSLDDQLKELDSQLLSKVKMVNFQNRVSNRCFVLFYSCEPYFARFSHMQLYLH